MLIQLIPRQSHPTIFFAVNFPDPCDRVQMPPGWAVQLQRLHSDCIDMPNTVFAVDAATWLTTIIREVTFDLRASTVSCVFVDGQGVQWPLVDACVDTLEQIVADVIQVTAEKERERVPPAHVVQPEPSVPEPKPTKHKKQRSLLMSLVSSFNKLSLSVSLDSPTRAHASPPPSPRPPPPPPTFLPPSRTMSLPRRAPILFLSTQLQNRARSALVDAFRLFVLAELRARIAPGRYATWAAHGMLQRAESHMAFLVEDAGSALPPPRADDEDTLSDSTSSTDTDGSSVHTPVDSPPRAPFPTHVPRSPSPPGFSPEDLAAYSTLATQCARLRALLGRMADARADAAYDERALLSVLEVKSRRRAWSNRAYLGGARMDALGFAAPFRCSPLGRCAPPALEVCTGAHDVAALFPVTEEDEDEPVHLVQDVALADLESGLLLPFQPPLVRPRTQSIRALHAPDRDLSLLSDPPPHLLAPPVVSASPGLPSNALLCQPLKSPPAMLEPQTKFALFDHMELAGEDEEDITSEFTLAMDMPPPYSRVYPHNGDEWSAGKDVCPCR